MELPNLMEPMRGVIVAIMNKLEKDKLAVELGPDDGPYCETFAVNLFNRANRVDRAGQADDSTAKTFYVASIFLDVSTLLRATLRIWQSRTGCCMGGSRLVSRLWMGTVVTPLPTPYKRPASSWTCVDCLLPCEPHNP